MFPHHTYNTGLAYHAIHILFYTGHQLVRKLTFAWAIICVAITYIFKTTFTSFFSLKKSA